MRVLGISPLDKDATASFLEDGRVLVARFPRLDWWLHRHYFRKYVAEATADHQRRTQELQEGLAAFGLEGKLRRFNHHDTHAANAFYASGYPEALLVTLDGYGSGNC